MKKCNKCGVEKERSEFCKNRTRKDGLGSECKICNQEASRRYCLTEIGKKAKRKGAAKQWRLNSQKCKSRDAVNKAIITGRLVRPSECFNCESEGRIEAHHESYDRKDWLNVVWLCKKCHVAIHQSTVPEKAKQ